MKLHFSFFSFLFLVRVALAQPHLYVAPFRHDAAGAYTLIHDDFGAPYASGIEEYIDTMNYNRKLPICFAAITGECDKDDWTKANELIAHGHQILNHSMSHKCGQPQSWCKVDAWDEKDFPLEIDSSTSMIIKKTGKHPAFFVFPFDLFTDTMIDYLQYTKHYLGARSGKQNELNSAKLDDPFLIRYSVFRPQDQLPVLNEWVDKAIQSKMWAVRVMHGIEDESWAHITAEEYATHLDYVQLQIRQHKLWMATLSDVITYQHNQESTVFTIAEQNDKGQVTKLNFKLKKAKQSDDTLLTNKIVTVVIQQAAGKPASIMQEGHRVPFDVRDDKLILDVDLALDKNIVLTY